MGEEEEEEEEESWRGLFVGPHRRGGVAGAGGGHGRHERVQPRRPVVGPHVQGLASTTSTSSGVNGENDDTVVNEYGENYQTTRMLSSTPFGVNDHTVVNEYGKNDQMTWMIPGLSHRPHLRSRVHGGAVQVEQRLTPGLRT